LSAASIKSTPENPETMTMTFDFSPTHDFFDYKAKTTQPTDDLDLSQHISPAAAIHPSENRYRTGISVDS